MAKRRKKTAPTKYETNVMLTEAHFAYLVALVFEMDDAPEGLELRLEDAYAKLVSAKRYDQQVEANTKAGRFVSLETSP